MCWVLPWLKLSGGLLFPQQIVWLRVRERLEESLNGKKATLRDRIDKTRLERGRLSPLGISLTPRNVAILSLPCLCVGEET